jgi:hypothetical protein
MVSCGAVLGGDVSIGIAVCYHICAGATGRAARNVSGTPHRDALSQQADVPPAISNKGVPMMTHQLLIPDGGPATPTLAEPLTVDVIGRLESELAKLLAKLRQELRGDQPDPAQLEFESWSLHMHFTKEIL